MLCTFKMAALRSLSTFIVERYFVSMAATAELPLINRRMLKIFLHIDSTITLHIAQPQPIMTYFRYRRLTINTCHNNIRFAFPPDPLVTQGDFTVHNSLRNHLLQGSAELHFHGLLTSHNQHASVHTWHEHALNGQFPFRKSYSE